MSETNGPDREALRARAIEAAELFSGVTRQQLAGDVLALLATVDAAEKNALAWEQAHSRACDDVGVVRARVDAQEKEIERLRFFLHEVMDACEMDDLAYRVAQAALADPQPPAPAEGPESFYTPSPHDYSDELILPDDDPAPAPLSREEKREKCECGHYRSQHTGMKPYYCFACYCLAWNERPAAPEVDKQDPREVFCADSCGFGGGGHHPDCWNYSGDAVAPDPSDEEVDLLAKYWIASRGFADAVRLDTGNAYPWPGLEILEPQVEALLRKRGKL